MFITTGLSARLVMTHGCSGREVSFLIPRCAGGGGGCIQACMLGRLVPWTCCACGALTSAAPPGAPPNPPHLPGPLLLLLRRRSAYVMTGEARYSPGWMHRVEGVGVLADGSLEQGAGWNQDGKRRAYVCCTTGQHNLIMLRREALAAMAACRRALLDSLVARLDALQARAGISNPFFPKDTHKFDGIFRSQRAGLGACSCTCRWWRQ